MIISEEEYFRQINKASWAPGWEAVQEAFEKVYSQGDYLPAARFHNRQSTLEGFGIYPSPHGYLHIVTRGLSRIYPHPDAYMGTDSGWGFELTIKWPGERWTECEDAFKLLDRLANGVEVRKTGYRPKTRLWGKDDPMTSGEFAQYGAATVVVADTEVAPIQTVHGRVAFLQVVNISKRDAELQHRTTSRLNSLILRMKDENAFLPFHIPSPHDYLP